MTRRGAGLRANGGALVLVLLTVTAAELGAQSAGRLASVREDPAAHPVLAGRVSIDLRAVPLPDALSRFGELSGISIAFSRDVLPADSRITLRADQQPAGQVLNRMLAGTGLDALVSAGGSVAIARIPPVARPSAAAREQVPTGSVRGRVIDMATRQPLPGVFARTSNAFGPCGPRTCCARYPG